jgi:TM2 domain-containing membrane protein YozV
MWRSGAITADTLYTQEGFEEWVPLSSLSDLLDTQSDRPSVPVAAISATESEKRILPALVLCFFLGVFGAHAFYAGRLKQGIAVIAVILSPFVVSLAIGLVGSTTDGGLRMIGISVFYLYLVLILVIVHVICDLVRILVGSYKDGQGRKITKWT